MHHHKTQARLNSTSAFADRTSVYTSEPIPIPALLLLFFVLKHIVLFAVALIGIKRVL